VDLILTLWTVRLAAAGYAMAIWTRGLQSRTWWTAGCVLFLAHVVSAFHYQHHWSHDAAYAETARQTLELFGIDWGGGIYFNYLFTLVWVADAAYWWARPSSRAARPVWMTMSIHGFMAFMFFNGAVVFAKSAAVRWISLLAAVALIARSFPVRRAGPQGTKM
jgi:hypothetical protein